MICPHCGTDKTKIVESRRFLSKFIRRRRECVNACTTFITYEVYVWSLSDATRLQIKRVNPGSKSHAHTLKGRHAIQHDPT